MMDVCAYTHPLFLCLLMLCDCRSTAYNISHVPVQEEHLIHRMNVNQVVENHHVSGKSFHQNAKNLQSF